ncbi:MAG: hypothetical protein ACRDVN_12480 [Jiangellaceae bacterium]
MRLHRVVAISAAGLTLAACAGTSAGEPDAAPSTRAPTQAVAPTATPTPTPTPPPPELPRGGRTIFPEHRLVGFAGGRGEALGRLGIGDIDERASEIEKVAASYTLDGRTPLPVFELIAVIAHRSPADGGLYRTREPAEVVERYLAAARRHRGLLLLNVQPGRADFLDEVKALEEWLLEPDVGLALDPEWAVGSRQVPGEVIGTTTGGELAAVAAYLSSLVRANDLPEKVMVYHQFHTRTVVDEAALGPHPGVVLVKSIDGVGHPADKIATWNRLTPDLAPHVYTGFKLFYDEDRRNGPLMTQAEVLALRPQPSYVLYE